MVVVTKISIQNIRSHDSFVTNLSPNVTAITGRNGSGKTSIIEAIYISLQGTSFKSTDSEVLKTGSLWWRIDVNLDDDIKRSITFNTENERNKKKFTIDDKVAYRLSSKHKYPVVLFEPEDLRLLHGSPSRRRQFIDRFIGQLNPEYTRAVHKYERALKQRNNLLKNHNTQQDELFVWDVALSEYGSYIIEQRIAFIEKINTDLNSVYDDIAGPKDSVSVHYSHTSIGDIKQKILTELHANIDKDKYTGNTSVGPHRHDILFKFNDTPALSSASRGEVRTIVLALKFLEAAIIEKLTNNPPLILLDDVFSELDDERQRHITSHFLNNQIILTSTSNHSKYKDFHIKLS